MFEKVSCFILILCIALIPLSAESLSTFLQRLPSDSDAGFQAAKLQDLSVYQTWSKPLPHVIPCRAFTFVAAIEAAYTRKYCEDPNSSYYKAGYCERYAALKAANLPTFRLAHPNYQNFAKDKKALDLSELYFYDRVTTSWTTSSDSKHETGQPFCQVKTNKRVCESASLLLSEIRLPEEQYAEYIYDEGFFSDVRSNVFNACGAQGNTPTQEQVDQYSFSESKFDIKTSDNKPQQRAFIPFEARRHAQFGVDNAVVGSFDAVSDKIKFVEKCIYRNYEVAVHLKSGHSLLVIGYDRDGKKFLIKDHNQQFAVMEYAAVVDSMSTFDIVVEPAIDWSYPSLEEMWLGSWDVLVDGEYGKLVIRRTRRAPNITLEDNDLLNNDIAPLSTTQWARVGSFYGGTSDQHAVWGRLNNSNGKTIELIVNFDVPEPPPPSTIPIATPKGQLFKLRLFRLGGSSCVAVYATGETEKNGSLCPVLLKRPGQNPLGLIPRSPASVYLKERWKGRFHLWGDGAQTGVLELTSSDSMQTLTGSLRVDDAYDCVVTGSLVDDSHAKLTANYAGVEQIELDLFYHRSDCRLISGSYYFTSSPSNIRGLFGYRTERGDSDSPALAARSFFPYYERGAQSFNGYAISNLSPGQASLNFQAFTDAGELAIAAENPAAERVASGKQLALLASEIFGAAPTGAQYGYWIQLGSGAGDIGTFTQFGDGQELDGAVAWSGVAKELYFSRVYQGANAFLGKRATTTLSIANPTDNLCLFYLDLIGPDGRLIKRKTQMLNANQLLCRTLADLFEGSGTISGGYVRVVVAAGEGVAAAATVRLPDQRTAFSLNALYPGFRRKVYSAQMAHIDGAYFTDLCLINTGDMNREVTIRVVDDSGAAIGNPTARQLRPGESIRADIAALLGLARGIPKVGSIEVEANGPGIVGDVVFGEPGQFRYVGALALQEEPYKKAVFSQVANGFGFFTGLAIYNPETRDNQVTIRIFTKDGTLVGESIKNLAPKQRLSQLLNQLVPASDGQVTGYVVVESERGVVAQQLFASQNLSFLSAVPPTVLK